VAIQTNGQILIGGDFTTYNGMNRTRLARLNTDGSLDTSFDPGVGPDATVNVITLQPDGEILIGGNFSLLNNVPWDHLARLRSDGSVDISFDASDANGGGVRNSGYVYALAAQPDGKVIVGGSFTQFGRTNLNNIGRFNTNGTADATFNPGSGANNPVYALGLQSSGQIIAGGSFTSINNSNRNYLVRLHTDGSVDGSFNALIQDGNVQSLVVTP
jgi:uncharacterized delta-60 repeat protein